MPQLDVLTYLSQLLWLLIILIGFYLFVIKFVLPEIKQIKIIRDFLIKPQSKLIFHFIQYPMEQQQILNQLNLLNNQIKKSQIQTINQENWKQVNQNYLLRLSQLLIKQHVN
jgi:hypothetical protein